MIIIYLLGDIFTNLKSNSNLTNISALNNIIYIGSRLFIDKNEYYNIKLNNNSWICQNFEDKIYRRYDEKWDPSNKYLLCE